MKQIAFLCLVCLGILGGRVAAQVSTSVEPTDAQVSDVIAQIRNTPVSRLDANLPPTNLDQWLQAQAGPDPKTVWVFRKGGPGGIVHGRVPDSVEAYAMMKDGRSVVVLVAAGTTARGPYVRSMVLISRNSDMIESRSLGDLPGLLRNERPKPNIHDDSP